MFFKSELYNGVNIFSIYLFLVLIVINIVISNAIVGSIIDNKIIQSVINIFCMSFFMIISFEGTICIVCNNISTVKTILKRFIINLIYTKFLYYVNF